MRIPPIVWFLILVLVVVLIFSVGNRNRQRASIVGVGRSQVTTKMDLTDKLNPAILPDLFKEILREMAPNQKPKSEEFQKQVVQKLSERIMNDPEVNYRVDLNGDGNLDPVLVVPESIEKEAAVYSIRVPDPEKYPKDPTANADWHKIAQEGIELCSLAVTFNESARTLVVDAKPNEYLYEQAPHYRSEYPVQQHSWLDTYFKYMIFRDILFGPYSWFGPSWWGWYGPWYGGWHAPVYTRPIVVTRTRYRPASTRTTSPLRTGTGRTIQSTRTTTRTRPPNFVSRGLSRRGATTSSRTTRSQSVSRGFSGFARSFRGGSRGWGK